jgi:tetratricopeptide (TPR) repeat protein
VRLLGASVAVGSVALGGLAGSRGLFVGVAFGIVGLVALYASARSLAAGTLMRLSAAAAVAGVVALWVLLGTPAGERVGSRITQFAAEERITIYDAAVRTFMARPLTGFGPDSFSVGYARHRPASTVALGADILENSAHNWMLQAAVTTGTVGLLATLALLVAWMRQLRAAFAITPLVAIVAATAAAYYGQALVAVGTISVDWVPWVGLGATVAVTGARDPVRVRWDPSPLVGAFFLAAFLALSLTGVQALAADRAALVASTAFREEREDLAADAGRQAVRADPGRADHWNWLGLGLTLQSDWKASGDAFNEAVMRAPHDSTYWQNLARSRLLQSLSGDQSSGGPEAATAAAMRAIEVEPANASSYQLAADVAYSLGDADESIALVDLARERLGIVLEEQVVKASKVVSDPAAAIPRLQRLVQAQDNLEMRLALARVALRADLLDIARENARRVLTIDAANSEAQEILRMAGG